MIFLKKTNVDQKIWKINNFVLYATRYLGQGVHQEVYRNELNEYKWGYGEGFRKIKLKDFPITPCAVEEDPIEINVFIDCMKHVKVS